MVGNGIRITGGKIQDLGGEEILIPQLQEENKETVDPDKIGCEFDQGK